MASFDALLEHLVIHYRWVLVVLFLLPMSFAYNIWEACRSYVVFKLNSAPKFHERKVKAVQKQISDWQKSGANTKLCTARPGWQTMSFRRPLYKKTYTNIKINMVDILEVDQVNMKVRVEPLVTMGQLSRTLEALGLALPVVPEIDDLTVGGLVMGTGVETSSHIHGLFQHICLEYEVVLADGSVVKCSRENNPELFYCIPWSYGTLGFLTSVVIKVRTAKRYIRMQYLPQKDLETLVKVFNEESTRKNPHEFVEALVFDKHGGVVMLGDMADFVERDGVENEIGKWYKPWFFKHVQSFLTNYRKGCGPERVVEYIPLRDYYHRHTRSLFWELQDIIPFGNNVLFRLALGWLMPPKVSLMKLTQTEAIKKLYERSHVIQDMLVPIGSLKRALDIFHETFEVYPIWLCPFKLLNDPGFLRIQDKNVPHKMYVDIGVYGVPKAKGFVTKPSIRRIEKFVLEDHGFQMLYADTYTTREEFECMFSHDLYFKLRDSLTNCKNAFPEVYDKVNLSART